MTDRIPKPLYSIAGGGAGGGGKPERTKENMDTIERTPVAAALIADALSYGARMEDIGPLLVQHVPHLLVDPASPIKKGTIYGRIQRAHREAQKQRPPQQKGDQQEDYITYLRALHANSPIPQATRDDMRLELRKFIREKEPPLYWLKDDECRGLILPLIDGLQKTGAGQVFPADIARVLSAHLKKDIDVSVVESYCKRITPGDMHTTVSQKPEQLSPVLIAWGQTEAMRLLKETRDKSRENIGRPSALDKSPRGKAIAAALLEKGRPAKAIETILGRQKIKVSATYFRDLLKKHSDDANPQQSAADELGKDLGDFRDTVKPDADSAWQEHVRKSFENKYLQADIFQKPEMCALLVVLLDDTDLPPETIVRLMNDRYKLKTDRGTLGRFVNTNGGRSEAATVLMMHKPEITRRMLEQMQNQIPALVARRAELEAESAAEGQKKRLESTAARNRVAKQEAQWLQNPAINQLFEDMGLAPQRRLEYITARASILRRMDTATGKPVMADGVTITLAKPPDIATDEARANHITIDEFLMAEMVDMEAGNTNALSQWLDYHEYGYVQLRGYGPKRGQYGQYVYPLEIFKTVFRDRNIK